MNSALYRSIEELPIYNWNAIQEKSDYTYLRRNRVNSKCTANNYAVLRRLYDKIFSEYVDTFGFSKEFLAVMEKKRSIALLKIEFIENGDLALQTIIEIAELELAEIESRFTGKGSFWNLKATIEKLVGFRIDAKTVTVVEFYSYIENLKSQGKLR